MSGSGQVALSAGVLSQPLPDQLEIEGRFGRITVNPNLAIHFPTGLLGMPDKTTFCLARFPSEKWSRFSILQSLQDHSLSFIVLPIDQDNPIVEREDFAQAAADLGVPGDDILSLLIVSVHRENGVAKLSVNARAPLLVRSSLKLAVQYVFPHTKYLIRQPLSV